MKILKDDRSLINSVFKSLTMMIMLGFLLGAITRIPVSAEENEATVQNQDEEDYNDGQQYNKPSNLNQAGYDVVYVIDNSKSIWAGDHNAQEPRNQAFKNITNLAVGSNNRIGAVFFADHVYKSLSLQSMQSSEGCQKILEFLDYKEQDSENKDTNIGNALAEAVELFSGQDPSREKILVLFSDGVNQNEEEDSDYAEAADEETKNQARLLESLGVKIYCIYLDVDDRKNEELLHKIVNYFNDENDYVDERFFKANGERVSDLSPAFAKVFFDMQNNMKFIQLQKNSFDSNGEKRINIPAMGIKKLNIYLDGNVKNKTKITPAGECENEMWTDGTASFYSIENPPAGDWIISIDGLIPDDFYGTISCYTDLSADFELENVQGEKGIAHRAIVHFCKEDGSEIAIDDKASVFLKYTFLGESKDQKKEQSAVPVQVSVEKGIAVSDEFVLTDYGKYRFDLEMTYQDSTDDFVDLSYEINTLVNNLPPQTNNKRKGLYFGERLPGGGLRVMFDEKDVFSDPEGGSVMITDIMQLIAENPVDVEQKGGYIILTSPKTGSFGIKMLLEDEQGNTAETEVSGQIRDLQKDILTSVLIVIFVLLIILLNVIRKKRKGKLERDYFKKQKKDFRAAYYKVGDITEECDKAYKELINKNKETDNIKKVIVDLRNEINNYSENMPDDLKKIINVDGFLKTGFLNKEFKQFNDIKKEIENAHNSIITIKEKADGLNLEAKGNIEKKEELFNDDYVKTMKQYSEDIGELKEKLDGISGKMAAEAKRISNLKIDMDKCKCTIREMMDDGIINCSLMVSEISGFTGMAASMSKYSIDGKTPRKGYYRLDDCRILGQSNRKLSDYIQTNIYVMGYYDNGIIEDGVVLRSLNAFSYKTENMAYTPVNDLVVHKGESLSIKVRNQTDHIMTLTVRS